MKHLLPTIALTSLLTLASACYGAGMENAFVKAVSDNGVISLYKTGEKEPFAALPAQTESGETVELVSVDGPFIGLRVSPQITGEAQTVKNLSIPAITINKSWADDFSQTLGTAGLRKINDNPGSYMYVAVAQPESGKGVVAAWLTTDKASGIVFTEVNETAQAVISAQAQYGRWEIPANAKAEDYQGEILLVGAFDDCRFGLEAYSDLIVKQYNIKLLPQPSGYCTWYSNKYSGAGSEQTTREFIDVAAEKLVPFGFNLFQIDDKWQMGNSGNGPNKNFTAHNPNGPYPSGMKATADYIASKGITAGIWMMVSSGNWNDPYYADKQDWFVKGAVNYPLPGQPNTRRHRQTTYIGKPYDTYWGGTCLDFTHPDVRQYVHDELNQASDKWGYRYFKLDGLWTAMGIMQNYVNDGYSADDIGEQSFKDMSIPQVAIYRSALKIYKESTDNSFILGCCVAQNMRSMGASYGLVDAIRIGPDNGPSWNGICRGPVRGTARYFYNGKVWYNDPDPVYVRDSVPLSHAQLITTWAAISGQLYLFSDWLPELSDQRVDVLKRTMAPHKCTNVRPVDLFSSEMAQIWNLSKGDYTILGLYNWDANNPITIDKPLDKFDLDARATYAGFDFWGNTFIPPFEGSYACQIPGGSCRALSLRKMEGKPVLVSTSRHVTSPLFEVEGENWNAEKETLSGVSAVVAQDPYELRIIADGLKGIQANFITADGKTIAGEITQIGPTLRVKFTPEKSGKVQWNVTFTKGRADEMDVAKPENFKAQANYTGIQLTWNSGLNFGYELIKIRNNDKPESIAVSGTELFDTNVKLGDSVTYKLAVKGWGETRSDFAQVFVTMPDKIIVPPVPEEPELNIADMKALRMTSGWGKITLNRSIGGEAISLDGKKYDKGIGVHANSSLIYNIPADKRRFVAMVGMSDSQRTDARRSVIVKIWTNVCEMGEPEVCIAQSPVLSANTVDQWNFDLKLDDRARQIRLEITDSGDGNSCDHADWVNTGFSK